MSTEETKGPFKYLVRTHIIEERYVTADTPAEAFKVTSENAQKVTYEVVGRGCQDDEGTWYDQGCVQRQELAWGAWSKKGG